MPLQFLTPEWAAALDEAARAVSVDGADLTVAQEVEGAGTYALVIEGGRLSVRWGPCADADVTLVQSRDTAEALARGRLNAQQAFVTGRLRVRGDLEKLVAAREVLAGVGDVFAAVRERTEYG